MRSVEQRLKDEKDFHNEIFESGARESVGKFYAINEVIENDYFDRIFQHTNAENILEYGCGMGDKLFLFPFIRKQSWQVIMELKNTIRS